MRNILLRRRFRLTRAILVTYRLNTYLLKVGYPVASFVLPGVTRNVTSHLRRETGRRIRGVVALCVWVNIVLICPRVVRVLSRVQRLVLRHLRTTLRLRGLHPRFLNGVVSDLLEILSSS